MCWCDGTSQMTADEFNPSHRHPSNRNRRPASSLAVAPIRPNFRAPVALSSRRAAAVTAPRSCVMTTHLQQLLQPHFRSSSPTTSPHPSPTMSAPAQPSFRSQLSSFRWANSVQDDSAPTTSTNNPFARAYSSISNSVSDYVPLRSTARSDEEEAYFALSVSCGVGLVRLKTG
jgi:hypothetical protein